MQELMTIQNVRGYIKDGVAYLNLEDVARGLGFTRTAESGNEVVRWERVNGYLNDLGVPTSGYDEFIPENIFYRLAMKAKNETAEKFQAIVADEILPSIRKTGTYSIQKPVSALEALAQTVAALQEQEKRLSQIETTQLAIKEAVISQPDNWREDIRNKLNSIVQALGENKFKEVRSESYKLLEQRAGVNLRARLINKQARMFNEGVSKSNVDKVGKIDIIEEDKKLREIYSKIVSEYIIRYVA